MSYYIIIRGPLGSGKSTISKALAAQLDATLFSVDQVLEDNHLTTDREDGYISQNSFLKVNELVAPRAIELLQKGVPVIFDGNFYWKSQIDDLENKLAFPHAVFTLKVPLEVCIQRDSERPTPHGEGAATVVYEKTTSFSYGFEIDAAQPLDVIVQEIIFLLSKVL